MTCSDWQNLLPAFHRGELTGDETQNLREHLRFCADCSTENERVASVERYLHHIRAIQPVVPDGDSMTAEILQRILPQQRENGLWSWADELSVFLLRPGVRTVYAMIACFLLGMFLYQQGETFARVRGLEERIAQKKGVRIDVRFTLDAARAQAIAGIGHFPLPTAAERGLIVLDRQAVTKGLVLLERQFLPGLRLPGPSKEERSVLESTFREMKKSLWIR